MSAICRFLFPVKMNDSLLSGLLLAFRVLFGVLLMLHGFQKLMNFDALSSVFPDPLGIGNQLSLILAIFGELVCSLGFVAGFLYRLVLIPMIFTMAVAYFVIHGADPFSSKELAFIYLIVFVLMYIVGPGKYSLDYIFAKSLRK